jgi:hypothetical protein
MSGAADALEDGMARTLRIVAFAMGTGLVLLAALSIFFYERSSAVVPTPQSLRLINTLTIISAGYALVTIVLSEILWKRVLSGVVAADANAKTQQAFVVRAATREGGALLASVTFFLACGDGVLRAYPAYWIDLAPAALLLSFLYLHWPSLENLKAEVAATLPTA